jgi:hypothetical protein
VSYSQEKSVFCVEHNGYCYVQDASGGFLGNDGRWTDAIAEAWVTGDRVHAETVARQQNEKRERDAARARR